MRRIWAGLMALVISLGFGMAGCGFEGEEKAAEGTVKGHVIPGPGEPGYDPALEAQAERYFRAMAVFCSAPFGMALDTWVGSQEDREVINRFITQNPQNLSFQEFCLQDPDCNDGYTIYDTIDGNTLLQPGIVKGYGEWGDLGMFGGVAATADFFRYAVLKEQGYPEAMVAEARERVKKILYANHIAHTITGTPGVIVRGIRLLEFAPKEGELIPLFDAEGNPLPKVKRGVMRPDSSPGGLYPGWAWADDTSKDQVDGWMFLMGVAWDVVAEDPDIPQNLKDWLVEDARNFGKMLRTVAPETGTDMVMRDGDGRLVTWCDVNPNVISFSGCPGATSPVPVNSFNAIMGLGFVKVLHHVTGDEELRAFYYDDLIGTRHWDDFIMHALVPMVDTGYSTNYSNVNMAFVAYYNALRYEADPVVRKKLQWSLEHVLWDNGGDRQPSEIHQSFFDIIHDGLRRGGHQPEVVRLGLNTLKEFPQPLVWGGQIINCDAAEIAQGWCLAIDDATIIQLPPAKFRFGGHGNSLVAEQVVPRRLRANSNFEWRDDPFSPNGGWGNEFFLMHEGDWLAAYWMGRYLRAGTAEDRNVSPLARRPVPPEAPNNLVARAVSESQINLSWHDATNKEREFVIQRRRPAGRFVEIGRVGMNQTIYSDLNLPPDTTFEYRVAAVNKTGAAYSAVAGATTYPAATQTPAGASLLSAVALDHSRIKLTWQDNSNNEAGFKILREDIGALALVNANVTEFIDTNLEDNTTYRYVVVSYNSKGDGWPSNSAEAATPKLPGIFIIQPDVQFQVPIDLGEIKVGFEDPVLPSDVTVEVSDEVGPINGTWSLDAAGTTLTFIPDPPLLTMETEYTVKVTVEPVVFTYKFRTEGALWAVDIAAGEGRAFAMNIFRSSVVEPPSLADMLSGLGLEAILLVGIVDADPLTKTMQFIGALGNLSGGDPTEQDMNQPTLFIPQRADLSGNPLYLLGPFDFPISIEGYEVTIQQVSLTGIFEENYQYSGKGEFQGDLDVGLIAELLGMPPQDICALVGGCNPCPADPTRAECVHLYIKNIRADAKPNPLTPIAAVIGKDLGGSPTQHTLEFSLIHPETGAPEVGVDITLTVSSGNGVLDQTTITTGPDGKASTIITDLDGGVDDIKVDIASAVPYEWVRATVIADFSP